MKDFQFGIDELLKDLHFLKGMRIAVIGHPASVTSKLTHTVDALIANGVDVVKSFGPQHGMRGDKQDNMVESEDYVDPQHQIPVVSLYGKYRYPQEQMLKDLDGVLFDLQDIGCRVYTFITTLRYFVEACAKNSIPIWVLDRPNPIGRPVDGLFLQDGAQSFVGCDLLPMRHGLTTGELACWFADQLECSKPKVIKMKNYFPCTGPGFGWPLGERAWVNPSPNAGSINMARCFPGTVLVEGTTLSEGRGTTYALEVLGAPDFPTDEILAQMPSELLGNLRPCFFTPTFHKHANQLCRGIRIHTDHSSYQHDNFNPFYLVAMILKYLRQTKPDYDLWRYHEYEYEHSRIPIDVICGSDLIRKWIDEDNRTSKHLEETLTATKMEWHTARQPYLLY